MSWTATKSGQHNGCEVMDLLGFFKAEIACGLKSTNSRLDTTLLPRNSTGRNQGALSTVTKGLFLFGHKHITQVLLFVSKKKHSSFLTYCHTDGIPWNTTHWFNRVTARLQQEARVSVTIDFSLISFRKHLLNNAVVSAPSSSVPCIVDQPYQYSYLYPGGQDVEMLSSHFNYPSALVKIWLATMAIMKYLMSAKLRVFWRKLRANKD